MKKLFILSCITAVFYNASAQVGINTETPHASAALDITSSEKGLLIPRVVLNDTTAALTTGVTNAESLMVYNTGSTNLVKGFYTWMDSKWVKIGSDATSSEPKFAYTPSISLPVGSNDPLLDGINYIYNSNEGIYTVKVYEIFKKQFVSPIASSDAVSPNISTGTLGPLVKNVSDYTFYVTYADHELFKDIKINAQGELTYTINPTAIIRDNSFMNIVVKFN